MKAVTVAARTISAFWRLFRRQPPKAAPQRADIGTGDQKKRARRLRPARPPAECELLEDWNWRRMSVDDAMIIRMHYPKALVRCPECQGPVRLHGASRSGSRAHVEHREGDAVCPSKPRSARKSIP